MALAVLPLSLAACGDDDATGGKGTHEAQLIHVDGAHISKEVLDVVTAEQGAIPEWFHGAGGAGSTGPGQTVKTTLNLPAGT